MSYSVDSTLLPKIKNENEKMNSEIYVTKRSGELEPLNLDKIHKVLFWACDGITGVSVSEIELRASLQFVDGITTREIHDTIIRSAADLISEQTPNYQFVAARLINYQLRKEIYDQPEPPHLLDIIKKNVRLKKYDADILIKYTEEELNQLNSAIKHARDFELAYVAMEQFRGKYLVKNRTTNEFYETPQVAYMMIAATAFIDDVPEKRMQLVKDYYELVSTHRISLPTPILSSLRKPTRQFSSCTLIDSGDDLESIIAAGTSIVRYVSERAGIGINGGRIRAVDSEIGGGEKSHTGVTPFYRYWQAGLKSCSQGGIRGGSGTLTFPFFHYEFDTIIVLKNNKGTENNRIRQMDYCIQFNRLFYKRLISGGEITFFSPHDVPDLMEAFYQGDNDRFEELYEQYENDDSIRQYSEKAYKVATRFMIERKETGRIYVQNIDHANSHGSFLPELAPITMTNLCVEIDLPTKPLKSADDPEGWIALCTLSAINTGKTRTEEQMEHAAYLTVRALDNILDYQDYVVPAAATHTRLFRPLGIGMINLAYLLAKNDLKYDDDALEFVDDYAEMWSFYLIKASMELAKERGSCDGFHMTKWSKGILPMDTRCQRVDDLVPHNPKMDWEWLREQILINGMRNSTTGAFMPAESSAQAANGVNGVEPPRGTITIKTSKHGVLKQVIPEIGKMKNKYDYLWDQPSPKGYLHIMAVLQKWTDQGISVNTSYNPDNFEDGELSMKVLLDDFVEFYKYGGKQMYYFNTYDGQELVDVSMNDTALPLEEIEDDDCESCKL